MKKKHVSPDIVSKIRHLSDWCGGCAIFKNEQGKCQDPVLDKMWKRCTCKNCLIKPICNDTCEISDKFRSDQVKIMKKIIEERKKKHGGIGEVA